MNKYDVSTYLPQDNNIRCFCKPGTSANSVVYVEQNKTTGEILVEETMMIKPDGCCDLPWPNHVNNKWFTPYGKKGKLVEQSECDLLYKSAEGHKVRSQNQKDWHANRADGTSTPKTPKAPKNWEDYLTKEESAELKLYTEAIETLKKAAAERKADADEKAKADAKKTKETAKVIASTVEEMLAAGKSPEEILAAIKAARN